MEEVECLKMLNHLQQYVPHLETLILQLKDPKHRNRELQLGKLEGLHSMITDRKRKLKLDTLKKCEDVLLKILQKVNPNTDCEQEKDNSIKFMCKDPPEPPPSSVDILNSIKLEVARARLHEISVTSRSPSPSGESFKHESVMIPTEKVRRQRSSSWEYPYESPRNRFTEKYKVEKPDVYRKLDESVSSTPCSKGIVFDGLEGKVDMSKPPLTDEDLLQLTASDEEIPFENRTEKELQDLREILQIKLQNEEKRMTENDLHLKLLKEKSSKHKLEHSKPSSTDLKNTRSEKMYEPNIKFCNLLFSVDEKLADESSEKRRDKFKDCKYDKNFEKDQHYIEKKERKNYESDRDSKLHKRDREHEYHKDHKSKHKSKDKDSHQYEEKDFSFSHQTSMQQLKDTKPEIKEAPIYKRLADKYNPRPRKHVELSTVKDNDQKNSIVENRQNYKHVIPSQSESSWSNSDNYSCDNSTIVKSKPSSTVTSCLPSSNPITFSAPISKSVPSQSSMHSGNTYMNTFILQTNIGNNTPAHSQFQNSANPPQNTFHNQLSNKCLPLHNKLSPPQPIYNQMAPQHMHNQISSPVPKIFYPYERISSSEYDLSKIQPVDFYSDYKQKQLVPPSPPSYSHRPQYDLIHPHSWTSDNYKPSTSRDPFDQSREEPYRGISSRDPRIRAREERLAQTIKKLSTTSSSPQRKLFPEVAPRHDFSQVDHETSKGDSFVPSLNSFYATDDTMNKASKEYGIQNLQIPKKQSEPISNKIQSLESEGSTEIKDVLENIQEIERPKTSFKESEPVYNENNSSIQEQIKDVKVFKENKQDCEILTANKNDVSKLVIVENQSVKEQKEEKLQFKEGTPNTNTLNSSNINSIVENLLAGSDTTLLQAVIDTLTQQKSENNKFKRLKLIIDSDSDEDSSRTKSQNSDCSTKKQINTSVITDSSEKEIDIKQEPKTPKEDIAKPENSTKIVEKKIFKMKKAKTLKEDIAKLEKSTEIVEKKIVKIRKPKTPKEDIAKPEKSTEIVEKKIIKMKKPKIPKEDITKPEKSTEIVEEKIVKMKKHIKRNLDIQGKKLIKKENEKLKKKKIFKVKSSKITKIMKTEGGKIKKKRKKYRTELDMLHQDIKGMFTRDGVVTANRKQIFQNVIQQNSQSESKETIKPDPELLTTGDVESASDSSKCQFQISIPKILFAKAEMSEDVQESTIEFEPEDDEPLTKLIISKKIIEETSNILSENTNSGAKFKPKYIKEEFDEEKMYTDKNTPDTETVHRFSITDNVHISNILPVKAKRNIKSKPKYVEDNFDDEKRRETKAVSGFAITDNVSVSNILPKYAKRAIKSKPNYVEEEFDDERKTTIHDNTLDTKGFTGFTIKDNVDVSNILPRNAKRTIKSKPNYVEEEFEDDRKMHRDKNILETGTVSGSVIDNANTLYTLQENAKKAIKSKPKYGEEKSDDEEKLHTDKNILDKEAFITNSENTSDTLPKTDKNVVKYKPKYGKEESNNENKIYIDKNTLENEAVFKSSFITDGAETLNSLPESTKTSIICKPKYVEEKSCDEKSMDICKKTSETKSVCGSPITSNTNTSNILELYTEIVFNTMSKHVQETSDNLNKIHIEENILETNAITNNADISNILQENPKSATKSKSNAEKKVHLDENVLETEAVSISSSTTYAAETFNILPEKAKEAIQSKSKYIIVKYDDEKMQIDKNNSETKVVSGFPSVMNDAITLNILPENTGRPTKFNHKYVEESPDENKMQMDKNVTEAKYDQEVSNHVKKMYIAESNLETNTVANNTDSSNILSENTKSKYGNEESNNEKKIHLDESTLEIKSVSRSLITDGVDSSNNFQLSTETVVPSKPKYVQENSVNEETIKVDENTLETKPISEFSIIKDSDISTNLLENIKSTPKSKLKNDNNESHGEEVDMDKNTSEIKAVSITSLTYNVDILNVLPENTKRAIKSKPKYVEEEFDDKNYMHTNKNTSKTKVISSSNILPDNIKRVIKFNPKYVEKEFNDARRKRKYKNTLQTIDACRSSITDNADASNILPKKRGRKPKPKPAEEFDDKKEINIDKNTSETKVISRSSSAADVSNILPENTKRITKPNPKYVEKEFNDEKTMDVDKNTLETKDVSNNVECIKKSIKSESDNIEVESDDRKMYINKDKSETKDISVISVEVNNTNIKRRRRRRKKRGDKWTVQKKPSYKKTDSNLSACESPITNIVQESSIKNESIEAKLIQPDINYFYIPHEKLKCEICLFKGKTIVQHYIVHHPTYEVLISRMSPAESKKAIEESIACDYESFVEEEISRLKKYTFQCRFCHNIYKNVYPEFFFDHIASHTGEYRFTCNFCIHRNSNIASLRVHLYTSHNCNGPLTPNYMLPLNLQIVFGYICSHCYFIQLDKKSIEKHVLNYHKGEILVHKINMSIFKRPKQHKTQKRKVEVTEEAPQIKTVVALTSIENPKNEDNATVVFGVDTSHSQESGNIVDDIHEKLLKVSTITPKKRFGVDLLNKIRNRLDGKVCSEVEKDSNLMKIDNSINNSEGTSQRNSIVENEKGKDKSEPQVNTDKSYPLNILVQDFNKDYQKESTTCLELPTKPNIVKTSVSGSIVTDSVHSKSIPDATEISLNQPCPKLSVPEPVQNMIRLSTMSPPPLVAIKSMSNAILPKKDDILIRVGSIIATKKDGCVIYSCNMESCLYSSIIPDDFLSHCQIFHAGVQWDGICNHCKVTNYIKPEDAYNHIMEVHKGDLEIETNESTDETSKNTNKPFLRMRRLSGDKLSDVINIETAKEPESPIIIMADESPFQIVNVESLIEESTEEVNDFPFKIENVMTLTPEEEEQAFNEPLVPVVDSAPSLFSEPTTAISTIDSDSVHTTTTVLNSTLIPFTLSDQDINDGLNFSVPVNIAASPTNTSSNKVLISTPKLMNKKKISPKDIPMEPYELDFPRKTDRAVLDLIIKRKLIHFYKCPVYDCSYSTDEKRHFKEHLLEHKTLLQKQIPCLYCNFKVILETIVLHYDTQHSYSQFCCFYCLYRAVNQSYVEIHQDREHHQHQRRVLRVPMDTDPKNNPANVPLPRISSILRYYECSERGCQEKFISGKIFVNHLAKRVDISQLPCKYCRFKAKSKDILLEHMETHNFYYYNCRYCAFGAKLVETLYRHLSQNHSSWHPKIMTRDVIIDVNGFCNSIAPNCPFFYELEPLFHNKFIKLITNENPKYITPEAVFEMKQNIQDVPITSIPLTTVCNVGSNSSNSTNQSQTLEVSSAENINTVANIDIPPLSATINSNRNVDDAVTSIESVQEKHQPTQLSLLNENLRPASPVILDQFLSSTQHIIHLTPNVSEEILPLTSEPISKGPEFVDASQPEMIINLDEPLLEIQESNKEEEEEAADPLLLEPTFFECSDTAQEAEFEAKLDEDLESHNVSNLTSKAVKKQGLTGAHLFKCSFCKIGFHNTQDFRSHINKCVENNKIAFPRPFKCFHCTKCFKISNSLIDHIRLHGTERYNCSLCDFKHQHHITVRTHMKTKHNVVSVSVTPVNANKSNFDEDKFVVRPRLQTQKSNEGVNKNTNGNNQDDNISNKPIKLSYGPEEIDALPLHPIFSEKIKCSACSYITNVRANLVRHFQFHRVTEEVQVPATTPVNPVPCLDKKEKMFDKMTNLAMSSLNDIKRMNMKNEKKEVYSKLSKEEEAELPQFIPTTKRYVCGAKDCDYLCLEESMLRCHLMTLHGNDDCLYKCIHCNEKLFMGKGIINVDIIITHLRFHDLQLYKCQHCKFVHNIKHKVEEHTIDKHTGMNPLAIVIRDLEQPIEEVQELQQEEPKEGRPWRCGMCKYRTVTKDQMSTHVLNKHNLAAQFKCALCTFKSNEKIVFINHFDEAHSGQNLDVIDAFYNAFEMLPKPAMPVYQTTSYDTTPLWQRADSKIKHIRGIPLEETVEQTNVKEADIKQTDVKQDKVKQANVKQIKKSSNKSITDKVIEAVATETSSVDNNISTIPKKPKTLKEKKMELLQHQKKDTIDEIVADNDEPAEILVDSEAKRRKLNDNTSTLSLKAIKRMNINKLYNLNAKGDYGPFGKPVNKQFLCPVCDLFKSKKEEIFKNHLYKELHYSRFVCTYCGTTGISLPFLKKHAAAKHVGIPEAIHPMSPDYKIEDWVEKAIMIQKRLFDVKIPITSSAKTKQPKVNPQEPAVPSTTKSKNSQSGKNKCKCEYCDYTCSYPCNLRRHVKRHWVQKPLKCGYCDFKGVANDEVLQHLKRVHPNKEPTVLSLPTPAVPSIQPIVRHNKSTKTEKSNVISSTDKVDVKECDLKPDSTQENDSKYEETIYVCNYCSKQSNIKNVIKDHWSATHKSQQPVFKYKTFAHKIDKAKCFYCDYIGQINGMRDHCHTNHPVCVFKMLRCKCDFCDVYCQNNDQLKIHHDEFHLDAEEVCQEDEEEFEENKGEISCSYCNAECDTQQQLLEHCNMIHPHLKLQNKEKLQYKCPQCIHVCDNYKSICEHVLWHAKPYKCSYCQLRFTYPAVLKRHHETEHNELKYQYKCLPDAINLYETLKNDILILTGDGKYETVIHSKNLKRAAEDSIQSQTPNKIRIVDVRTEAQSLTKPTARKSTTPFKQPRVKQIARKSTTLQSILVRPHREVGFSYYGNKPDMDGVEKLKTKLTINSIAIEVGISQLNALFNISPIVAVVDIHKHPDKI